MYASFLANMVGFQTPAFAHIWRRASPTITLHSLSALFANSSSRSSDGHRLSSLGLSTHDGKGRDKLFPNTTTMADDDDESTSIMQTETSHPAANAFDTVLGDDPSSCFSIDNTVSLSLNY